MVLDMKRSIGDYATESYVTLRLALSQREATEHTKPEPGYKPPHRIMLEQKLKSWEADVRRSATFYSVEW
jgi:hypothetical protein